MTDAPAIAAPREIRTPGALVIEIVDVTKVYEMGSETIHALRGVSLSIRRNEYVLADEPTGNLDSRTGEEIMALLEQLYHQGNTIIVVTHEPDIAAHARRIVRLRDGLIESDAANLA